MLYFRRERGLLLILIVHRASLPRLSCRGVAQPGRAPGSGPGGRRFKSSLPDNRNKSRSTRRGIRKEKTMTWQEITTEMVSDVAQITSASPETESVIGIIQWQAKILAGLIFQPNIPFLTFQDSHKPQDGHTA